MWGYAGYEAISRGIVTPRNTKYIILFITKVKQNFFTQYQDNFAEGILDIEGETNHQADKRIIESVSNGDEIYLFYRIKHHMPFIFKGRIFLIDYTEYSDKPNHFRFANDKNLRDAVSSLETESITHGVELSEFVPNPEGRKKIAQSIRFERSRKNRKMAIELHGKKCVVCGFDFDVFYGADLSNGYIEAHHVKSVAELEGEEIDIENDMMTVCSNCHSMAHRIKGKIISIEDLRKSIKNQKAKISPMS